MFSFLKKNIIFFIILFYFIFLLIFYIKEYEVPDFFLYNAFANRHLLAKDGFSSLFIRISKMCLHHSLFIQIFMAVLMASGMFLFLNAQKYIKNLYSKTIYILFVISLGSFWYFYGKIFYEFPFICFIFGLILNLSITKKIKCIYLIFYLAGFCLSWKLHAVFPLFGFFLLLLIYRRALLKILLRKRIIIFCLLFIILGYISGNYNLLINFSQTLSGIKAYPAHCDITTHLFTGLTDKIWDHVNCYGFNTGVCNIATTLFVLFVMPFFQRKNKFKLFGLNLFISVLYLISIKFCSKGFLWQSFPFSLYIICNLLFILKETEFNKIQKNFITLFCMIQVLNNFVFYIPREIKNFKATEKAYYLLKSNSSHIIKAIKENTKENEKIFIMYNMHRKYVKTGNYPIQENKEYYSLMRKNIVNKEKKADIIFYVYNDVVYENTKKINKQIPVIYDKNGIKIYKEIR